MSVGVGKIEHMIDDLHDLDAAGLLARASEAVQVRRRAEVHDLEVLAQWAAVHSSDPTEGPDGAAARRLGNVLVQVGGDGTPGVQDFCLGEIALARGTGVMSSRNALADVLDLQHRLPLTWAVCVRGECEVWVARRVAKLSRHLGADKVGLVDSAMSRMIATESAGRVLEVAEAKVIEADPALHEEKTEAERRAGSPASAAPTSTACGCSSPASTPATRWRSRRPCAGSRRSSPPATPRRAPTSCAPWRSPGWRGRPSSSRCSSSTPTRPRARRRVRAGAGAEPGRPLAFPADLLDALRDVDLRPLAPKAVLHVHLHEAALAGTDAVARVEGFGPVTLTRLTELLRRFDVRIQPVKDLSDRVRYTAYEHPETLRDQVHLVTGGDYWPYATSTSRNVDLDHPTPYNHGTVRRLVENPRRTRPAPTTPAPSADDTTAGRPTRATSHASAAKAATSGSPRTASRSSSTTPAPTASTPRRHG